MRIVKFYHNGIVLDVPSSVYYPREDSLLLAKVLKKDGLEGRNVLEMGCGSGFLSIVMAKNKAKVTAVDISKGSVDATRKNAEKNGVQITCFNSDLFSAVTSSFDLIVFNPPYLPEGDDGKHLGTEKHHLIGGKTGREVIEKFIASARAHLNENGRILLLISSLTGEKEVAELFHANGFKMKILAREKIPWEELMVIEASLVR